MCAFVCMCITAKLQQGLGSAVEGKAICVYVCISTCVSLCMLESISPGQGDTGISRDEPQIEEAVIEVFKKVRGD